MFAQILIRQCQYTLRCSCANVDHLQAQSSPYSPSDDDCKQRACATCKCALVPIAIFRRIASNKPQARLLSHGYRVHDRLRHLRLINTVLSDTRCDTYNTSCPARYEVDLLIVSAVCDGAGPVYR